jgi:hypothetical protein
MRSEARALLAQMTEEHGTDGVLRLETHEGTDRSPGSEGRPPRRDSQHRIEDPQKGSATELSAKLRAVNERSQNGRP